MIKKIEIILSMWHEHFESKEHQYSEFQASDIEYYLGCLLYNHFAFSKVPEEKRTMALSYNFIAECGNEYNEVIEIIGGINFDDELDRLEFLQEYIRESRLKYSVDESYLLDRLKHDVDAVAEIYNSDIDLEKQNI